LLFSSELGVADRRDSSTDEGDKRTEKRVQTNTNRERERVITNDKNRNKDEEEASSHA
jgi:hypothetical protein